MNFHYPVKHLGGRFQLSTYEGVKNEEIFLGVMEQFAREFFSKMAVLCSSWHITFINLSPISFTTIMGMIFVAVTIGIGIKRSKQ